MSLHYLVKYLCSRNRRPQEVIEANGHVRLSQSKKHVGHIKIPLSTVHHCCNKENDVAAECRTLSAIDQSQMALVCQS